MARTIVLIILDGWGIGRGDESNPIHMVQPQTFKWLEENYPVTSLQASGIAVGGSAIGWSHKILASRNTRLSARVERSIDGVGRIEISLEKLRTTADGISSMVSAQNGRIAELEAWRLYQGQELVAFYRDPPWAKELDKMGNDLQAVLDKVNLMHHEWTNGGRPK